MSRNKLFFLQGTLVKFVLFSAVLWSSWFQHSSCFSSGTLFFNTGPTTNKKFYHFYAQPAKRTPNFKLLKNLNDVYQIEPSDAISATKYSQPEVESYGGSYTTLGEKVPSSILLQPSPIPPYSRNLSPLHQAQPTLSSINDDVNVSKLNDATNYFSSNTAENRYQSNNDFQSVYGQPMYKNNFTKSDDNLLSVPSDPVSSIKSPSDIANSISMSHDNASNNFIFKPYAERDANVPSHDQQNITTLDFISSTILPTSESILTKLITETSVIFKTHSSVVINETNENETFMVPTTIAILPSTHNVKNITDFPLAASSSNGKLSSGIVAGIVISVLICVTLLSSAVIYLLYRRYSGKCTSVVESKFNSENCGYLDDSLRSSMYLNNHIELPKENSEEMTSLDNDSFLNSLETMTIQNYWADNTKNTKV